MHMQPHLRLILRLGLRLRLRLRQMQMQMHSMTWMRLRRARVAVGTRWSCTVAEGEQVACPAVTFSVPLFSSCSSYLYV